MWNGDFRSKREVSMRGKSARQTDRKEHLERLRKDREQRAQRALEERSSRRLQAVVRSFVARRKTRRQVRAAVAKMMQDVAKVEALVPSFRPPVKSTKELVHRFLFGFDETAIGGQDGFGQLCGYVLKGLETDREELLRDAYEFRYVAVVHMLFRVVCVKVARGESVDVVEECLEGLLHVSKERRIQVVNSLLQDVGTTLHVLLLSNSTQTNAHTGLIRLLWEAIADVVNANEKPMMLQNIGGVVADVLQTSSQKQLDQLGLVETILEKFSSHGWLMTLRSLTGRRISSFEKIFANLLHISFEVVKKDPENGSTKLSLLTELWNLIGHILHQERENNALLEQVQGLDKLRDPWFIQEQLKLGLTSSVCPEQESYIIAFCAMLEMIRLFWTKRSSGNGGMGINALPASTIVVSAVAFAPRSLPLVAMTWEVVLAKKNKEHRGGLDFQPLQEKQHEHVLHFLCSCTTKLISALDDEEVFRKEEPFKVDTLASIASYLKGILFETIWRLQEANVSKHRTIIDLFNQLHDRNLRHQIMPYEEWLFPMVEMRELGITGVRASTYTVNLRSQRSRQHRDTNRMRIDSAADLMSEDEEEGEDVQMAESEDEDNFDQQAARRRVVTTSKEEDVAPAFASERVKRVLQHFPQVVPFQQRVLVFDHYLQKDLDEHYDMRRHHSTIRVTVRRGHEYMDAFSQLKQYDAALKSRIQIEFVNQQGLPEAGIDGGGVFKEFLLECCKQAFDPDQGFWNATPKYQLYPNPNSRNAFGSSHLEHFEFMGKILGKAAYEGILLELNLADFFLNLVLGNRNQVHDLQSLDPEIYRNVLMLKSLDDLSSLDLTFSVVGANNQIVELLPNGAQIPVTGDNYIQYISRLSNFRLNEQFLEQTNAFRRGFGSLISVQWISMFKAPELQLLIGGSEEGFNVEDMEKFCTYSGGYHPDQPYIQMFWKVVGDLTKEHQAALLRFITSCSKPPLHGFGALRPRMCISQVRDSGNDTRLCTASTCVNLLKLPKYSTEKILKEKLIYSITSAAGFELS